MGIGSSLGMRKFVYLFVYLFVFDEQESQTIKYYSLNPKYHSTKGFISPLMLKWMITQTIPQLKIQYEVFFFLRRPRLGEKFLLTQHQNYINYGRK